MINFPIKNAGDKLLQTDVRNLRRDLLNLGGDIATSGGSANAYTLSLDAQIDDYVEGMIVRFYANHTNTGASTINVNGIGAVTVEKNGAGALPAGSILAGYITELVYDGAVFFVNSFNSVVLPNKGDLLVGQGAGITAPLTAGNNYEVLTADSGETLGAKWSTSTRILEVGAAAGSKTNGSTLLSYSVPANLLKTKNGIRFKIYLSSTSFVSASTNTFNLTYGGTTVAGISKTIGATSVTETGGWIEGYLFNNGATNSQIGCIAAMVAGDGSAHSYSRAGCGTATKDSTTALTLTVDYLENGPDSVTHGGHIIELCSFI
jgi:hypothetical protein